MTETHPQNRRFGYARVSTVGQTLDSQLEQLRAAGCAAKIYREKQRWLPFAGAVGWVLDGAKLYCLARGGPTGRIGRMP